MLKIYKDIKRPPSKNDRGCNRESGEIVYKCVSAIIYRYRNGKLDICAEVTDYCGHSISIINPERAREIAKTIIITEGMDISTCIYARNAGANSQYLKIIQM